MNQHAGHPLAIAAVESGAAPEWVQLWPAGTAPVTLSDGRGPFTLSDAAEAIRASLEGVAGGELPIDYDHALDYGQKSGASGRAAGWITALDAREDGSVWGRVAWTAAGDADVAGRNYRFISPVFHVEEKSGRVQRFVRAALTNRPAMHTLKAVAATENTAMDEEQLAAMRQMLDLPEDANGDQIVKAMAGWAEDRRTAPEKATDGAGDDPDPEKFVPKAAYDELAGRVAAMEGEARVSKAEKLVDAAEAAGKVQPALRGWALQYAGKDPDGFQAWAEKTPALIKAGEILTTAPETATDGKALTASEQAVARQLGLTDDAYAAARDEKTGDAA